MNKKWITEPFALSEFSGWVLNCAGVSYTTLFSAYAGWTPKCCHCDALVQAQTLMRDVPPSTVLALTQPMGETRLTMRLNSSPYSGLLLFLTVLLNTGRPSRISSLRGAQATAATCVTFEAAGMSGRAPPATQTHSYNHHSSSGAL